jgi:hypothetical protein
MFINLTPFIPLSFKGEGEEILEEGLAPLLNAPNWVSSHQRRRDFREGLHPLLDAPKSRRVKERQSLS